MAKGGRRLHTGPKLKPKAMKVVQGTFREDRDGGTPMVPARWPEVPTHLNSRERALWAGLEAHCALWVAPSDWPALNGVVSLLDRLLRVQEAQQATAEAGAPLAFKFTPAVDGELNAEPKENPLLTLELKFWRELRAYIGIVGLSPVDRARVHVHEPEKVVNPLERFVAARTR